MSASNRPRALVVSNIPWDFVWQRHQSIATLLSADYDVGFVELAGTRAPRWRDLPRIVRHVAGARKSPCRPPETGAPVWLTRPLVLPASNSVFCRINAWRIQSWINRDTRLRPGFDLVVTYSQTRSALQIIDAVQPRQLVYDCTDDWLQVAGIPTTLATDERELLDRADLTLVPSRELWERKQSLARRCVQLPHGVWADRFDVPDRSAPGAGKPVTALYYGHLLRQHLAVEAIEMLARAQPTWRVILVGPIKDRFAFPPNVELPGQVPHTGLRQWIEQADVLLLPYAKNDYTEAVMPAKTFEVLATGRPVVATPLRELRATVGELIHFAPAAESWSDTVIRALAEDTPDRRKRRRDCAAQNSWTARYVELKRLLAAPDESVP